MAQLLEHQVNDQVCLHVYLCLLRETEEQETIKNKGQKIIGKKRVNERRERESGSEKEREKRVEQNRRKEEDRKGETAMNARKMAKRIRNGRVHSNRSELSLFTLKGHAVMKLYLSESV